MSKFFETIEKYTKKIGWGINTDHPKLPKNTCDIFRTTSFGEIKDAYRIELVNEEMVVFYKRIPLFSSKINNLPDNLSNILLYQNSAILGFWGIDGGTISYSRQVFLSELNESIFKEIVEDIESETNEAYQLFG